MGERAILSIRYTPVTKLRTLRAGVGGFLRYIQYRDQHEREESDPELSKLLKYVAHRDRTAPRGRLFDGHGRAGDLERRQLERHVVRSVHGIEPRQQRDSGGRLVDRQRAVYQMVFSPEHAQGLDLQRMARTVMAELEREVGHPLPPWLAAEHRNTAHPHVHIVMAARREIEPGRFRTFMVSRERLASMKLSLAREIERQRERERGREPRAPEPHLPASEPLVREARPRTGRPRRRGDREVHGRMRARTLQRMGRRQQAFEIPAPRLGQVLRRLAIAYQREAERQERELEMEDRGWS